MSDKSSTIENDIFQPKIQRILRADWIAATVVFLVYLGLTVIFRTVALVAIWLGIFWLVCRSGRRKIGLRSPNHWAWWLAGPLLGLLFLGGTALVLWPLYGWQEQNMFYDMAQAIGAGYQLLPGNLPDWVPWVVIGFGWVLESPFLEEPLFRGLMLGAYREKWGFVVGVVLQALAFTLVHPVTSVSWVVSIFVAGIVYGLVARYSRSLWPAVLAHSAYNIGVLWIAFRFLPELIF